MRRAPALLFAVALSGSAVLAGCETTGGPPVGASDQQIEAQRFQVTYRGRSGIGQPEVADRALLHAAQVTLAHGFDWFRVVGRSGGPAPPTSPAFSFGIGGVNFGRGAAIGGSAATTVGGQPSFVAMLEVVAGRAPAPNAPDVYDARQVVQNLGARYR